MSDDVKARARQVLRPVSAGGTVLRGLHGEGVESLVADLLAALEAAENADDMVRHVADQRNEAMAERDAARAVIRRSWEFIAAREGLGVYDRQDLLRMLGGGV